MLRPMPKLLLLVALLSAFLVSSASAFAGGDCECFSFHRKYTGGCQFDKTTSQCVNVSCKGLCFGPF